MGAMSCASKDRRQKSPPVDQVAVGLLLSSGATEEDEAAVAAAVGEVALPPLVDSAGLLRITMAAGSACLFCVC